MESDEMERRQKHPLDWAMPLINGVLVIVIGWVGTQLVDLNRQMAKSDTMILVFGKQIEELRLLREDTYRRSDAVRDFGSVWVEVKAMDKRLHELEYNRARK